MASMIIRLSTGWKNGPHTKPIQLEDGFDSNWAAQTNMKQKHCGVLVFILIS